MATLMKSGACDACAKAKRRCGRQSPACERCKRRGVDSADEEESRGGHTIISGIIIQEQQIAAKSLGPVQPSVPGFLAGFQNVWFLTPNTWSIIQLPVREVRAFCNFALKRFINELLDWVAQWVVRGSNPFIHARLYRERFPRSAQDAYASMLCYRSRTSSNEDTVMRIIQDRATQLVLDEGAYPPVDTLEHLARVHALVVYSAIRLFDGDIRQRHMAEQHLPVLGRWAQDLLESAARTARSGRLLAGNIIGGGNHQVADTLVVDFTAANQEEALWHAWILAESVRRTWLLANGIQAVFSTLQRGESYCAGGLMFTTRDGVWDAPSACAWTDLCAKMDVWFMTLVETPRLFLEARPEEVDVFGKTILELNFGIESIERWDLSTRASKDS